MIDLVSIERSTKQPYKYKAVFSTSNGRKITHFGHVAYEDYTTIHKDRERRDRYRTRHRKDLETEDPTRAGFLSYYILWNKPTLEASVRDYTRRLRVYNKTGVFPID
eukprot:998288-Pleurochrysis_carterae.AAC.1